MSNPMAIREGVFSRLTAVDPYRGFQTKRKTPVPALQESDLPALSVFILAEDSSPDGQGNQGPVKFINDTTIGISVARAYSDPLLLQGQLDADVDGIKSVLLNDASFTKMGPNALFESVEKVRRTWMEASEGEAYLAELRLDLTFRYREDFAPVITTPLEIIDVKTNFPSGGTAQEQSREQQVHVEYTFPVE